MSVPAVAFTAKDHQTWSQLFKAQSVLRDQQLVPEFSQGLIDLGITEQNIPDIEQVNSKLQQLTGWQGVYTQGFVEVADFFYMLAQKKFPIGNFIRDPEASSYTPAPDVFHDFYGHLPFFSNREYADFCQQFGNRAYKYKDCPQILTEFQRLFWFTIEFGLVKTAQGIRIVGAGIGSSFSECAHALSERPRVHSFNVNNIRQMDFRIDRIQEDLFLLESLSQLYLCLDEFEKAYQGRVYEL